MITGTKVSIEKLGGYQSKGGWVYTFSMTIQGGNGPVTGEIGSKTEVYPMNAGETISVEPTNTQHGMKFKKINADYQQQPPQQNGQQAAPQPTGATNDPNGMDSRKQSEIRRGNALNAIFSATEIPSDMVEQYLNAAVNWIKNGKWLLNCPIDQPDKTQPGVTEYVPVDDTPAAVSDDDIPY